MIRSTDEETTQQATAITCAFLDIGVMLTDGWDRHAGKRAATHFKLELAKIENRQHLTCADIFRLALEFAQALTRGVVYIESTPMFVQVADGLGIRSILQKNYQSTCAKLGWFGLQNDERVIHGTSYPTHPDVQWRLVEHQVRVVRGR